MATLVGTQTQLVSLLNQLIELDYDAIEAYDAAIERLENGTHKAQLSLFRQDHRRHVADLAPLVRELGGTPATKPDIKAVLTKGKVVLGGLVGDKAILLAMRTNEQDTNVAYERSVARNDLPQHMRALLERNLADERRHRDYLSETLGGAPDIASPH